MITDELKSHFLNMYLIAMSDVDFDEKEMDTIMKIGVDKGITQKEIEQIIINPTQISLTIPEDIISKIEYLFDFGRIIWADGRVDKNEKRMLLDFCVRFGFEEDVVPELTDWLLEISKEDISHDELKEKINELLNS